MRVITGKAKGHKLKAPCGFKTRPTADRVKESIFNIIGDTINNSVVLDLYSGSGNIGIEFLSRGAQKCFFIESDVSTVKIIKENLDKTGLINQAYVFKNLVLDSIKILSKKEKKFDFIFMDPPYNKNLVIPTLNEIHKSKVLEEQGVIIIEHESKTLLPDRVLSFIRTDTRKYGDTSVTFYKIEEDL